MALRAACSGIEIQDYTPADIISMSRLLRPDLVRDIGSGKRAMRPKLESPQTHYMSDGRAPLPTVAVAVATVTYDGLKAWRGW